MIPVVNLGVSAVPIGTGCFQSSLSRGQSRPIHLHAIPRKGTRKPQALAISEEDPRGNTEQDRDSRQDGPSTVRAEVAVHGLCQERHEARDNGPDKGEAREGGGAVEKVRIGKKAAEGVGYLIDGEADGNQREGGRDPGQVRCCWWDRPAEPEEPEGQGWRGKCEAHNFVFSAWSQMIKVCWSVIA